MKIIKSYPPNTHIVLTIKPIMVKLFEEHSPIPSKHILSWYPFLDAHHSNLDGWLKQVIKIARYALSVTTWLHTPYTYTIISFLKDINMIFWKNENAKDKESSAKGGAWDSCGWYTISLLHSFVMHGLPLCYIYIYVYIISSPINSIA